MGDQKRKLSRPRYYHSKFNELWRAAKPLLKSIDMELTERCNNNCLHCCINQPQLDADAHAREMSTAQCKELLRQAVDLGALTVRFTGGEPLLRADFAEIYLFARQAGLRVLLLTNGRLISAELADLFAKVPPLEKIEITAYGPNSQSYEALSQKQNSFSEFREGLGHLLIRKIPFVIKGTVLSINRHEMSEFISWSASLLGERFSPSFVMSLEMRHRRDSASKNTLIAGLRLSPKEVMDVIALQPENYRESLCDFCVNFLSEPSNRIFNCDADNGICVDAYGKIQYCLALRHPDTVLDSARYSLEYALKEFMPGLRLQRAANEAFLSSCGKCFLRGLCEHCPAKSWNEHGTLDQPVEYWCQIAHEQARYLGMIAANEHAWEVLDWRERIRRLGDMGGIKKYRWGVSPLRIEEIKNES